MIRSLIRSSIDVMVAIKLGTLDETAELSGPKFRKDSEL